MLPDNRSLILAPLSLTYSLHRPPILWAPSTVSKPAVLSAAAQIPATESSFFFNCWKRLVQGNHWLHEGRARRRLACSTCASPSGTTLSPVENTFHRHRFTKYYHNLQLKIRGVLGAVLDAWMVVRCWVLKSILRERKKQGRLTSDSDQKPTSTVCYNCLFSVNNVGLFSLWCRRSVTIVFSL